MSPQPSSLVLACHGVAILFRLSKSQIKIRNTKQTEGGNGKWLRRGGDERQKIELKGNTRKYLFTLNGNKIRNLYAFQRYAGGGNVDGET